MSERGLDRRLILALALALLLVFAFTAPRLSILIPGPEGVRALNYGVQFGAYGPVLRASQLDELPQYFYWGSTQPSVMTIGHREEPGKPWIMLDPNWYYDHGSGMLRSEVQRPVLASDPFTLPARTLTYHKYVRLSDEQVEIRKIVVHLVPADFVIQLSPVRLGSGEGQGWYSWRDIRIWYALDTVTWLNAYTSQPPPDPDPLTNSTVKFISSRFRGAFPIIAWIGEYKDWVFTDDKGNVRSDPPDDHAPSFVQLDPSLEGRYIDLFTSPGQRYRLLLSSTVIQDPGLLESALSPDGLPDPRFAETVYFYIHINRFGPYVQPTGWLGGYSSYTVWYPSVWYRLRVVYALYGEYVYLWTSPAAREQGYLPETWVPRETELEDYGPPNPLQPLSDWFTGLTELGNLVTLLVVAAVVVIVARTLARRGE
jgi:hypothetical protein